MKNTHLFAIFFFIVFGMFSQDKKSEKTSDVTTYYLIRHAEKDRTDKAERDPHLTEAGLKRADNWSTVLANVKFDAVYSTDYFRTKETAQPTATKNNLEITIYDPRGIDKLDDFLKATKGKTVLVVGHSNTTPAFVNSILGTKKYDDIDDSNNGNLFIVTIIGGEMSDQVLTIN